jgi:hypothetical protein
MLAFTTQEWVVLLLVFLFGLLLGMAMMAGGKWKTRYRDEVRKREAAEAERSRLASQLKHHETHSDAAHARDGRDTRATTPIA